jgi:hypothetical protein
MTVVLRQFGARTEQSDYSVWLSPEQGRFWSMFLIGVGILPFRSVPFASCETRRKTLNSAPNRGFCGCRKIG